ncbi:hypothetical protein N9X40_02530 [bacterium]|nr:hypothetical protein [bacterium]
MRIGKQHSLGRQFLHMGRLGVEIALQHAVPVIHIIDRDEEDVWFVVVGTAYGATQEN